MPSSQRHVRRQISPSSQEFLVSIAVECSIREGRRGARLKAICINKTVVAKGPDSGLVRTVFCVVFGLLMCLWILDSALGKDNDDDDEPAEKTEPARPNTYLDLRTTFSTLPANTFSIGFSNPALVANLPTVSLPSSRSIGVDVPLTVDINDQVSLYGGISATTMSTDATSWTSLAVSSWNLGIQADVYQQNGGSMPTVTIQSTMTRSVPESPVTTTSLNTIVEANYALNKDETKGLLAGIQYTKIMVDTAPATVNPNIIGYVGTYYQWDNNWKLTGRAGIQSFGGARLLNLTPIAAFTQPIVRVDLDRMDDNDNRLFGVTAQIAWTPKPSYQLVLRTPLYLVRN